MHWNVRVTIGLFAVAGIGVLLLIWRDKPPAGHSILPSAGASSPVLEASTASPNPDSVALDALSAVSRVYPLARAIPEEIAKCDEIKGFDNIAACYRTAATNLATLMQDPAWEVLPNYACGKEVYAAHGEYALAASKHVIAHLDWLGANQSILKQGGSRRLYDLCERAGDRCYELLAYPSFAVINGITCIQNAFFCGPPDEVCLINKMADRIGLGDPRQTGRLVVRATGTVVGN